MLRVFLKKLLNNNSMLNRWVYDYGVFTKFPLSTLIVNSIVNTILFQNKHAPRVVNFKSRVVQGGKLQLLGSKKGTYSSLVNSCGCYLQAGNGIEIDEGTIWADNVVIVSANHDPKNGFSWDSTAGAIKIGKCCWLGANSVILPNVVLGDNTIVGAGAVVTKSFPEGNIVIAGNPAKMVRIRGEY